MAKLVAPDDLIRLQREALQAQEEAVGEGYTPDGWRPWVEASAVVQLAISERAATDGVGRVELEMAVKQAAREG